jgi:thiamine-phosphate pyrophosphorylase
MAKPHPADSKRSAPRLYLITPPVGEADAFTGTLSRALAAADVAAVLLHLRPDAERTLINRIKTLAAPVQSAGVALVLDSRAELVGRSGADGAHLTGIDVFTAASEGLRPARIAGCGGLKTRHDAMLAGERGADYVMFGEPDAGGRRPSFEAIVERIEWWAEVFEIPCVAFAADSREIAPLAAAGADFIAVGGPIWDDPRGSAAAVAEAASQLLMPEAVP